MKILIAVHAFFPMTGGIETITALLAEEFVRQGHSVRLVTHTPFSEADQFPYEVIRQPERKQLLALVKWCDICFHSNICLQMAWPLLLIRRPWVIVHHTWISRVDGGQGWQDRLKLFLLRFARNIAISQAIADHLPVPSVIIGNAYQENVFHEMPEIDRTLELVFLGRLVSDKGVDVLIDALNLLKQQEHTPRLTIIGTGSEQQTLEQLALDLGVREQISFVGQQTGDALARTLNRHQILVVPSRWKEPFGIVALEGIACGCVVVGSEEGGLKDAIGLCGATFPNGDANALAQTLLYFLRDPERRSHCGKYALEHLARFRTEAVAKAYLTVFEQQLR